MGKAIGTTNLWMSYKDDPDNWQKLQAELKEWDNATIIRILASTATKHRLDYVTDLLKQEEQRRKKPQLFILCDGKNTETFFGETFAKLVDARPASQAPKETSQTPKSSEELKLESIIETRAQRKKGGAKKILGRWRRRRRIERSQSCLARVKEKVKL